MVTLSSLGGVSGCKRLGETMVKSVVRGASVRTVAGYSTDELRQTIQETNEQCPVRMDAFTTLVGIEVIDETNVQYSYLVDERGSQRVAELDDAVLRDVAIDQMKENAIAVAVADHGLSVRHVYRDQSGQVLLSYVVDKETLTGNVASTPRVESDDEFANITDVMFVPADTSRGGKDAVSSGHAGAGPQTGNRPESDHAPSASPIQSNPFFES